MPVWKMICLRQAMATPLSDLAYITERMLRVASQLTTMASRWSIRFDSCLAAYHRLTVSLDEGATLVPASVLVTVRQQLAVMEEFAVAVSRWSAGGCGGSLTRLIKGGRWESGSTYAAPTKKKSPCSESAVVVGLSPVTRTSGSQATKAVAAGCTTPPASPSVPRLGEDQRRSERRKQRNFDGSCQSRYPDELQP